jgi:amino acid transporter
VAVGQARRRFAARIAYRHEPGVRLRGDHLAGPVPLRLLFHGFVVLVGTLILSGAVNTAIIGSNGVLNRVAEDGVLPDWFRHPHRKYGTSSCLINLVVGLQLFTIIISPIAIPDSSNSSSKDAISVNPLACSLLFFIL